MIAPEFEEQLARLFAGVSIADFEAMPGVPDWCNEDQPVSKSDVVALYRTHKLIEAVQADIEQKRMKRR